MTPTHDTYLEDGTYTGLTVDTIILAYALGDVNIPNTFISEIQKQVLFFG